MAKSIGKIKKLPTSSTNEFQRVFKKLGFSPDNKGKHTRHIVFRNLQGKELVLVKGNKKISAVTVLKKIKEISEKTGKSEKEVIEFFFKNR
jgi:hypothetical protein